MAKEKKKHFHTDTARNHNEHNYIWIWILNGTLDALQLVEKVSQLLGHKSKLNRVHFEGVCIKF